MAHFSRPRAGIFFYLHWIDFVASLEKQLSELVQKSPLSGKCAAEALRLLLALANAPAPLVEIAGPCCPTPELVNWLGISRQGIHKGAKEHRIVAIQLGRTWYYPTWQMRPDRALDKNVAKVQAVLREKMGPIEAAQWWVSGDEAPCKAIFNGQAEGRSGAS